MIIKINVNDEVNANHALYAVGKIVDLLNSDIDKLDQLDYMHIGKSALSCKFSVSRAGNVFINVGKAE